MSDLEIMGMLINNNRIVMESVDESAGLMAA